MSELCQTCFFKLRLFSSLTVLRSRFFAFFWWKTGLKVKVKFNLPNHIWLGVICTSLAVIRTLLLTYMWGGLACQGDYTHARAHGACVCDRKTRFTEEIRVNDKFRYWRYVTVSIICDLKNPTKNKNGGTTSSGGQHHLSSPPSTRSVMEWACENIKVLVYCNFCLVQGCEDG